MHLLASFDSRPDTLSLIKDKKYIRIKEKVNKEERKVGHTHRLAVNMFEKSRKEIFSKTRVKTDF